MALEQDYFLKMRSMIRASSSRVALKTDAWSSCVYKGDIVVTAHWICKEWKLNSTLLDFHRFMTPHNGEAVRDILFDVMEEWGISKSI